jgi:hypothetical protein
MYSPIQFVLGLAIIFLAMLGIRNHVRRWRNHPLDSIASHIDALLRRLMFPIVFLGGLLLLGWAMICSACLRDGVVAISFEFPYFTVDQQRPPPISPNAAR